MAERSFKQEVKKLRLGAGEEFRGEGILAVTKALLQAGVSYVSGYQGAPISHLVDALAASINYPLRGAATFKATVGTNVASDALANLASSGVTGGALIIVGEDYGEGSSIMQERSHAFAMKSQIWLIDPRPNLPSIVRAVEKGFELSEASNTPVMLELRIRACHVYGSFTARDNVAPERAVNPILRRADIATRVEGKSVLPMAGEYIGAVMKEGIRKFVARYRPDLVGAGGPPPAAAPPLAGARQAIAGKVHARPPSFCTGCPERPIFAAMKLVERELGPHHVSGDIGCHLFSVLPPFNIGNSTMGYGLGGAGAAAFNAVGGKGGMAIIGDGGFWHNGLASSFGNAVFNKSDNVMIVVDNGYAAATGGQDVPSSAADNAPRATQKPIEEGGRGVGV